MFSEDSHLDITHGFGTGPFHHFINLSDSPSLKLLPILGQTEAAIKKAFLYGAAQNASLRKLTACSSVGESQ